MIHVLALPRKLKYPHLGSYVCEYMLILPVCLPIERPAKGDVIYSSNETTYQTEASFSCYDGYELTENKTRLCMESGFWSGSTPECITKGMENTF